MTRNDEREWQQSVQEDLWFLVQIDAIVARNNFGEGTIVRLKSIERPEARWFGAVMLEAYEKTVGRQEGHPMQQ